MSGGGGAEPRPGVVRSVKAEGGEPHLIESGWNGRMLYAGRAQMAAQYESARFQPPIMCKGSRGDLK